MRPAAGVRREFVFRQEGFPPDSSTAFEFEPSAIVNVQENPPDPVGSLKIVIAVLRADLRSVTVRAGLAAGPWQTLAKRAPQEGGLDARARDELANMLERQTLAKREWQAGASDLFQPEDHEWTLLFRDPIESAGQMQISASHSTAKGWETRIVAVDLEGRQDLALRSDEPSTTLVRTTARFDKLPLAQIKEFQFQVRPYRWAEFRNVSLQAGHRTNVEVRDADVTGLE